MIHTNQSDFIFLAIVLFEFHFAQPCQIVILHIYYFSYSKTLISLETINFSFINLDEFFEFNFLLIIINTLTLLSYLNSLIHYVLRIEFLYYYFPTISNRIMLYL